MSAADKPGRGAAADLCKALGLDPRRVMAMNIRLRPDSLVTVTVVQSVDAIPLEAQLRRYTLVERDKGPT